MSTIEQAYRHIALLDGVRSGLAVVTGTRIAVHDVIGLILNGAGVDDFKGIDGLKIINPEMI